MSNYQVPIYEDCIFFCWFACHQIEVVRLIELVVVALLVLLRSIVSTIDTLICLVLLLTATDCLPLAFISNNYNDNRR